MQLESRIRNVTAVLGPTNTGKTHLAIERMLGHDSGMIGLPLRLLAREVYDKIASRVGAEKVALVTGEEKIKPERARYWVATVEAMPRDVDVDFMAVDEIQLASDPERGHVFTDRLLHARGRTETLLLGAQTMRETIEDLIPGANFISRPRLSKLTYAGEKKITRLPTRSAVIAFSAAEVYAIAELIRRQRGGTAVVLGALSPRTRNAQVALYQSGDVDFLVATDAIGMGLNLDVDHVAFSAIRKFDGQNFRNLMPGELGQIAGRAGRHMNDGTFGATGNCDPLDSDLVERLEQHTFDPIRVLQWRNRNLEFKSLEGLRECLREMPSEQRLTRARMADDVLALETVAGDREIRDMASTPAAVGRLWEVCQIPDYRKISSQNHAELVSDLYKYLMGPEGRIPEDWFAKQVAFSDRTDGDIDTLSTRLAHIRTWTFVSNRADWLKDPAHWQGRTRAIEDSLSDALHECLTQRFVDARTSALMKGMRDKEELSAEIAEDGAIHVESHYVGRLKGFRFSPETHADSVQGKASRHAASQVLSRELSMRARRVAAAKTDAFKLTRQGRIMWREEEIARIEASQDPLKPTVILLVDEYLSGPDKDKVQARLDAWIGEMVNDRLKPLNEIAKAEDLAGLARGIAFQLTENFGVLKRETVAAEIKSLDQAARAQLRKYGVRFGAFNIHVPLLLKPAATDFASVLWALKHAGEHGLNLEQLPDAPRPGLTSVAADPKLPEAFYRAHGYHLCGPRAIRLDILERLADLIRPLLAWRQVAGQDAMPPKGSTGDGGFTVISEMMSFLGCSGEELANVLRALGFRLERRQARTPAPAAPAAEAAPAEAAAETTDVPDATPPASADAAAIETAPPANAADAAPAVPPDATAEQPAEAAVPEVVWEEIWRPRRSRHGEPGEKGERPQQSRHRGRHHGDRRHGRPHAQTAAAAPAGTEAATATAEAGTPATAPASPGSPGQHRHRRGRGERRGGERQSGERAGGERPGQRADQPADHRPDHRPDHRRDRDRDGERSRRPQNDRQGRDGRRRDHGKPGGGTQVLSAAPPRKSGLNPDSPFASLGALREALEKQAKESSST